MGLPSSYKNFFNNSSAQPHSTSTHIFYIVSYLLPTQPSFNYRTTYRLINMFILSIFIRLRKSITQILKKLCIDTRDKLQSAVLMHTPICRDTKPYFKCLLEVIFMTKAFYSLVYFLVAEMFSLELKNVSL